MAMVFSPSYRSQRFVRPYTYVPAPAPTTAVAPTSGISRTLTGLLVAGENIKRDGTRRVWTAEATGAFRKNTYGETFLKVVDLQINEERELNLSSFTGTVGDTRFIAGVKQV